MTDFELHPDAPELPDGPYDVEFFLDPGCPFAWQTSRWLTRVAELRDLRIGWRFISLRMINEVKDPSLPDGYLDRVLPTHRVLRIAAAVRDKIGNDGVAQWYTAWGEHLWNATLDGRDFAEVRRGLVDEANLAALLESAGLPAELADAADDEAFDELLRTESEVAFDRAGDDLGTPIITYAAAGGFTYFGPVISAVPNDEDATTLYDAIVTLAALGDNFSELKRTKRPPLDLPILAG